MIYLAMDGGLAILEETGRRLLGRVVIRGRSVQTAMGDPLDPDRVYAGTFDHGLLLSADGGRNWREMLPEIPQARVMSVFVSNHLSDEGRSVVWAGTEPSDIFRSENGGLTWKELPGLQAIPSRPKWSFPPRPWTHHVRSIAPDPYEPKRILAGIELGGVMLSDDGGAIWADHPLHAQPDVHHLRFHRNLRNRVYEAGGGGYAESLDGGRTWTRFDEGLDHTYVWNVAADPGDPEVIVIAVSPGPGPAHNEEQAWSALYRRTHGSKWSRLGPDNGLPEPEGMRAFLLAPGRRAGEIWASSERRMFKSEDGGSSWHSPAIDWTEDPGDRHVNGLEVL